MKNRSVPVDTILPHVVYQDVAGAIAWLSATFGFVEHYRYGDPAQGAQLRFGDAWIMRSSARAGRATPAQVGAWTQSLTVYVDDVDAHCERSKAAGTQITDGLRETIYGERLYNVEDLEGHPWEFSQHVRDVGPREWEGWSRARSSFSWQGMALPHRRGAAGGGAEGWFLFDKLGDHADHRGMGFHRSGADHFQA